MRQLTTLAVRPIMAMLSALMMLSLSAGFVSSQSDAKFGDFLDAEGVAYIEEQGCGQYWPSKGIFQTTREAYEVPSDNPLGNRNLDNYGAVLTFRLTQAEKDDLLCVGEYLEIDFHLFGLATPAEWDAYTVSTNIPGAVHDTAATDSADQATPGLTYIRVSDLIVNHDYYAGISFTGLWPNNDGKPRVSFEWVPSRWASTIPEIAFCKEFRILGDAMCIFGITRAFLSHGYTHQEYGARESLVFDGFRFWEFGSAGPSPMPTIPAAPQPTIATSMTCNDVGIPYMTSRLAASPQNPTAATQVTLSVTLTNNGCGTFAPEVLAIGGRDPAGNVTDPLQSRDFVLGPGESRTVTQPVVLTAPGTHEFFMAYLRVNGGWNRIPDTSGDSSSMYVTVTNAASDSAMPASSASCSETGTLHASDRLSYSPESPTTATEGILTVTLTNASCGTFAPEVLAIGGRDPAGNVTDPLQSRDFVLGPGESRTITQPVVLTAPGTHEFFMAYLRVNGGWHRIPDANGNSASIYVAVTDAANVSSDSDEAPPEPTAVAPTTEPIAPAKNTTVTPAPVQVLEPQATTTSDGQTPDVAIAPTSGSGPVDIALITRDPLNGDLLTGACYVLVNYSNVGCDENNDGQVTFAQIPFGTYTVHQTQTPSGYPTINDYDITVAGTGYMEAPSIGVPLGFVVKQAPDQNAPSTRNVSVVFLDMSTRERVTTGACVELIGASNVGCDEDLVDGQVDFLDVPAGGPYELRFSSLPAGSEVGTVGGPLAVTIDAGPEASSNVVVFVLLAGSDNAGSVTIEPVDGGSSSGPQSSASTSGGTDATLLMTFRACPEEFNLDVDDYAANCTIPLDAPDTANLLDYRINSAGIAGLERQFDGTYVYTGSSPSASFILDGLAPVVRDGYTVVGHDDIDEDNRYWINFPNGGTRQIYVYYYYTSGASQGSSQAPTESGSATLLMTFRGCPEGFDPNIDDFYANCTEPLDAPDASFLYHGGDGQGGLNIVWQDRMNNGAYIYEAGPNTMNLQLSGMAPVLRDGYQVFGHDSVNGDQYTVNLVDGETREVYVFYYYLP